MLLNSDFVAFNMYKSLKNGLSYPLFKNKAVYLHRIYPIPLGQIGFDSGLEWYVSTQCA